MRKGIFFFVVLIVLVSGCSAAITQKNCEEKIKDYFPEKMKLYLSAGWEEIKTDYWDILEEERRWKDGSVMGKSAINFRRGSKPGENVNYYYSSRPERVGTAIETKEGFFTYEKAVIAEDGTILGHNLAFVSLTIKPILGTEGKGGQYTTRDFEIVDSNFSRCNWINE